MVNDRGWSRLDSAETRRDFLGRDRCLVSAPSVSEHFGIFCITFSQPTMTKNNSFLRLLLISSARFQSHIITRLPLTPLGAFTRLVHWSLIIFLINSLSSSIIYSEIMVDAITDADAASTASRNESLESSGDEDDDVKCKERKPSESSSDEEDWDDKCICKHWKGDNPMCSEPGHKQLRKFAIRMNGAHEDWAHAYCTDHVLHCNAVLAFEGK